MKIGIDARLIQGGFCGDRTYWRGLIGGISRINEVRQDEYLLYTFSKLPPPNPSETGGFAVRQLNALTGRDWCLWSFPRMLGKDGVQVAHVQYSMPPYAPCPIITSVHDVSFRRCPQFFSFKDRFLLDLGMRIGAHRAAKILVLSNFTRIEMIELYRVPPEKIEVVYPGVEEQFQPLDKACSKKIIQEKYSISQSFIVTVGVVPARKNIHSLIRAFGILKGILPIKHKLVILGNHRGQDRQLLRLADSIGISEDVVLTGGVSNEDLPHFYNAADLSVYPSVYEGFGLPALEAMACGVPVITSNLSALPEVIGDAGLAVDPTPEALADAMAEVLSNMSLRSELSARGLKRAKAFNWDSTARRVVEIYREVASNN